MGEFAEHSSASKLAAVLAPRVAKELGLSRVLPREEDKPQPTPQITSQGPRRDASDAAGEPIYTAGIRINVVQFPAEKISRDLPVMTAASAMLAVKNDKTKSLAAAQPGSSSTGVGNTHVNDAADVCLGRVPGDGRSLQWPADHIRQNAAPMKPFENRRHTPRR